MQNQHFQKSYNMDICRDSIFLEQSGKTWLPSYQRTKQQLGIIKHWLFLIETSIVQKKNYVCDAETAASKVQYICVESFQASTSLETVLHCMNKSLMK